MSVPGIAQQARGAIAYQKQQASFDAPVVPPHAKLEPPIAHHKLGQHRVPHTTRLPHLPIPHRTRKQRNTSGDRATHADKRVGSQDAERGARPELKANQSKGRAATMT
eukprot:3269185-Rhodomonas_salina.7